MAVYHYRGDLPDGLALGQSVAIDTETMGLKLTRDRLCLVQLSSGDGNAHLVQITYSQLPILASPTPSSIGRYSFRQI